MDISRNRPSVKLKKVMNKKYLEFHSTYARSNSVVQESPDTPYASLHRCPVACAN